MSTRAERRAAHYREDAERHMAPGHASHTTYSRPCTRCADEAAAAYDARKVAYEQALAEHVPYRPYTRYEKWFAPLELPFLVLAAVIVAVVFYGGNIGFAFGPVQFLLADIGYALTLLLLGTGAVIVISLIGGAGDRSVPLPPFPVPTQQEQWALESRARRNAPLRAEPFDAHMARLRPDGTWMTERERTRRPRRVPTHARPVVDAMMARPINDGLPWT